MTTITRSGLMSISSIIQEARSRGMVGRYTLSWTICSVLIGGGRTYSATIVW